MIDVQKLREELATVAKKLATRGFDLNSEKFSELDAKRKSIQMELENAKARKNQSAKLIGQAKAKGEDIQPLLADVENIKDNIINFESQFHDISAKIQDFMYHIPNLPDDDVPLGNGEEDNVVVSTHGSLPTFDFTPKEHYEIAEALNKQMDFELSAKLSGSRFVVLKSKIAALHRALAQFMLDLHTREHGYEEVYVPYLVKSHCMFGTGQFPKFEEDQFGTNSSSDLWLIPTAEVPVTNLVRDEIIKEDHLPLKYAAHTSCFRKEAGTYGKDTKGMLRQHQFEKVELVHIVHPDDSTKALEELTSHAQKVLDKLELPYRKMILCTKDMGFGACKTYDLEVWLPGQDAYREISSCSNTKDFQARRMAARYKGVHDKKPSFVHTLNGSGIAVGRALIAVIENYQQKDGSIKIPGVLKPYMNNLEFIK